MINEEKVILMTKLASYESNEGKKDIRTVNYFRGDYIGFQVLKSVIAATISFFALFAVYAFYNFEQLMQDVYKMDLLEYGKSIVVLYLCAVGGYGVISYILYNIKYSKAKNSLKHYYNNLKRLSSMYDK
ncbi:MAG: hypothetical protein K2H52_17435 [Lachnospiraceae bacterium]|nr:hypothetical protein [Lachnospiraceae bacterium]MDE6185691.1 hypothetical protein [Lachnospiraceae bacterium]MDE7286080.1 hypothetical protein [Lachnospiraceae bacterium]